MASSTSVTFGVSPLANSPVVTGYVTLSASPELIYIDLGFIPSRAEIIYHDAAATTPLVAMRIAWANGAYSLLSTSDGDTDTHGVYAVSTIASPSAVWGGPWQAPFGASRPSPTRGDQDSPSGLGGCGWWSSNTMGSSGYDKLLFTFWR